ncbi:hypothetical protein ASG72_18660 [Bosea sp. Leaf344]|uniref:GNAT family N-acetyltransferase n=1 Tax=Bosea sp. Leaf344 TaxID=1736346 RepID=UPI0006F44DE6|nr:GNAT family N-acetyltransferase [Bosea sp. Leaf344]KQU50028.1 hypothetical protein ASG72_18660 [Bosea sp. Leaf344]
MNQIMIAKGQARGAGAPAPQDGPVPPASGPLSTELRPLSACAGLRDAWEALASRALEPNLFFEPDFLLAAAQHLIPFGEVCLILVWQGQADAPRRRLVGLLPCVPKLRLFAPDELVVLSDRRIAYGAPLIDRAVAQAVIEALLTPRRDWGPTSRGLLLGAIAADSPLVTPALAAAERLGLSASLRPAPPLPLPVGIDLGAARERLERRSSLSVSEAVSRGDVRDAMELLLALEASGASGRGGKAALQETREVGFLRAMTRALARQRQCRVALLLLDGKPIAGALLLGRARAAWLYMSAGDDSHADCAPEAVLLAMLRRGGDRLIMNAAAIEPSRPEGAMAELRLSPREALTPRDLAGRARAALRRSFSRAPARRAG